MLVWASGWAAYELCQNVQMSNDYIYDHKYKA